MAIDDISGKSNFKQDSERLIAEYKKNGREREISKAIKELKQSYEKNNPKISKELSYLTGEHREWYLHDMKLCQKFAVLNRWNIADVICRNMLGVSVSSYDYFQQSTITLNMIPIWFAKVLFLQKQEKRF